MTRVLVIDDQPDVRAMIGIVLRINHFEVVEAGTAAAGIKAFEQSCSTSRSSTSSCKAAMAST